MQHKLRHQIWREWAMTMSPARDGVIFKLLPGAIDIGAARSKDASFSFLFPRPLWPSILHTVFCFARVVYVSGLGG